MSSVSSKSSLHLADGTARAFLARALLLPTGLVTTIYLTRQLGPENYGAFTLAITLFAWVATSTTSLFSRAAIKFVSEADDWRSIGATTLRLYLGCGLVSAVLFWGMAEPIATLLDVPRLSGYLRLLSLELLIVNLASAHRTILVGTGRFREHALGSALRWPARLVLIVLFVEMGLSVTGAVLGSVGATLILLIVYRYHTRPSLRGPSDFPAKRLWNYAPYLFFFALSLRLFEKIDLFLLKGLGSTTAQAGLYGAAQNLSIVPGLFAAALAPLLISTLSRLEKARQHAAARRIGRNAMRVVMGMLPFAGMTAGTADEIIQLTFGSAFASSAPLLAWLIFGGIALAMISTTTAILIALGRPGLTFALTGPLVLIAFAGHIVLIPQWGPLGAASVTTGVAWLGAVITIGVVHVIWDTLPPLTTLLRSVLIGTGVYLATASLSVSGIWVVGELLLSAVIIVLGFAVLGEFSASERASFYALLRHWSPLSTDAG